jgi:predicted PurR-regulated permease PerM
MKKMNEHGSSHFEKLLEVRHVPAYFLLACIIATLSFLGVLLSPFFTVIVFAAVLATAFHPMYRFIDRYIRNRSLSSLVSCIIVTLIIVVPFIILLFMLAGEGANAYLAIQRELSAGYFSSFLKWEQGGTLFDLSQKFLPDIGMRNIDISGQIASLAKQLSTFLLTQTQHLLTGIVNFFFSFVVMLITMFFFFRDGAALLERVRTLTPLPDVYEKRLFSHLERMMNATLYGTFLTAIVQGFLGGVGFALVGVSQPALWGSAMAFFALFPYVGTAFIWLPASIILLVAGHVWSGVFLFLWGVTFVSTIDNFLRPFFIGRSTSTYPLLMFLCILGGILIWGFPGIVFGPLILTATIALLEMYEQEYRPVLKQLDHRQV